MKNRTTANETIKTYLKSNLGKNILPLSILDNEIRPGGNPIEILLFYKREVSVLNIQEGFRKAVEHYNLFSSRLIMMDHDQFALQYCSDGAVINLLPAVNETHDSIDIELVRKMMTHVKTLPGEPLFALTVVPVRDGYLGGFSFSHAIGDGVSLILFLFSLGLIMAGDHFPPPSSQRLFTGRPLSVEQIDKSFIPPLHALNKQIQDRVRQANVQTYTTREYFSEEQLKAIKHQAKSAGENHDISNNQIMTSLLLKKYHHDLLPDTDRIRLRSPVNFRDIHPDIDPCYIGNALFVSFTEFEKDEIDRMPVYEIACRFKKSIMQMRNENFVKKISYLSEYGIEFQHEALEKYLPHNSDIDIVSTNLTHINDLESLGLGSTMGSILYIGLPLQPCFTMLKEKSGSIFAQITGRYPFT